MSDWQPIETAPKDGTFLVFNRLIGAYQTTPHEGEYPCLIWGDMRMWWKDKLPHESGRPTAVWYPAVSHWRPLPDGPGPA